MTTWDTLVGSRWLGQAELWEDPQGDVPQPSECSITIDEQALHYTWSYKGKAQRGALRLSAEGGEFQDSWHQSEPVACDNVPGSRSLCCVQYTYMKDWSWRINLCLRESTEELVLQMTNIAPWGEETRAW